MVLKIEIFEDRFFSHSNTRLKTIIKKKSVYTIIEPNSFSTVPIETHVAAVLIITGSDRNRRLYPSLLFLDRPLAAASLEDSNNQKIY